MLQFLATEAVRFYPISPAAIPSLAFRNWVSVDCVNISQVERDTMFLCIPSTVTLLYFCDISSPVVIGGPNLLRCKAYHRRGQCRDWSSVWS